MSVGFLHTRHAAQQHARRPSEDRLPTGGIFSAVGPGDPVGGSEKIHTGEAEMRQRTSRVGELYYKFVAADLGDAPFRLLSSVSKT